MKKILLLCMSVVASYTAVHANNILVSNANISGGNTTTHTALINFDVSWENSWRTSTNESNYDGAWIFVKFRKNGTTDWRHCTFAVTGTTAATGATFTVPSDGKGAFIYRSTDGLGNVNFTGNSLTWNYGADGILDNETVEIQVFALEMVYIPTGSYQLGSGGSETNAFYDGSTPTQPFLVTSDGVINLGTTPGTLNSNTVPTATGTVPAPFPAGYTAFWIMKYETSQQQYVDFLNHLDNARATANNLSFPFNGTHPNLTAPAPERAMYTLSNQRLAALADWSGLRPMTELEFEKASRGYNTPAVPNEYVWGNTTMNPLTTVSNQGLTNEAVSTPANANANIANSYNLLVRTGIFARPSGSDRVLSGGTYYGVMNMGDNAAEICFTIANAQGRAVDGAVNGDGYLAASGNTDISIWTPFQAYGVRGSAYTLPLTYARTSDRTQANLYTATYGADASVNSNGGRMVRTAP